MAFQFEEDGVQVHESHVPGGQLAFLPHDSHGKMNLDSPKQGPRFAYARAAAVKRTQYEFEVLEKILTPEMFAKFTDLQ